MLRRFYHNGPYFAATVRFSTAAMLARQQIAKDELRFYVLDERKPGKILCPADDRHDARQYVNDYADSERYGLKPGVPIDCGYTLWEGDGTLRHWALSRIEHTMLHLRGHRTTGLSFPLQAQPGRSRVVRVRFDIVDDGSGSWAWGLRYIEGARKVNVGRLCHWACRTEEQVFCEYARVWNTSARLMQRDLHQHHLEVVPVNFVPVPPETYVYQEYTDEIVPGFRIDFLAEIGVPNLRSNIG